MNYVIDLAEYVGTVSVSGGDEFHLAWKIGPSEPLVLIGRNLSKVDTRTNPRFLISNVPFTVSGKSVKAAKPL